MIAVNLSYIDQLFAPFCMIPDAEQRDIPDDCENNEHCMRALISRYCLSMFMKWGPKTKEGTKTALRFLLSLEDDYVLTRIVKELFEQPYMVLEFPRDARAFTRWLWCEVVGQNDFEPLSQNDCTIVEGRVIFRE
jgi:hypothetical protein